MSDEPKCPKCNSENIYLDGNLWMCPECSHEWTLHSVPSQVQSEGELTDTTVRDAYGSELNDGDSVTLVKELKIKGSSSSVKVGTKVRNIRIIDENDGHNISCKIDGLGAINLKSEFVKKA